MISTAWIYYPTSYPMLVYYKGIKQNWTQFLMSDLLRRLYRISNLRQRARLAVRNMGTGTLSLVDFVVEFIAAVFSIAATVSKILRKYIVAGHKLSIATLLISVEFNIVCMILGGSEQLVMESASLVLLFLAVILPAAADRGIAKPEHIARMLVEEKIANRFQ
jgi:hypothetical protein